VGRLPANLSLRVFTQSGSWTTPALQEESDVQLEVVCPACLRGIMTAGPV